MKQLRDEVTAWGEPGEQEQGELDDLFKEVPIASEQPPVINPSPTVNVETLPTSIPILTKKVGDSIPGSDDKMLENMQKRFAALRTGQPANSISGTMGQGINQSGTIQNVIDPKCWDTPASMTLPYPGLDGHPRRITPIPVFTAPQPSPSVLYHPPEKVQENATDLIRRLGAEDAERERLAEKNRKVLFDSMRFGSRLVDGGAAEEDTAESKDQSSGTNMSTIGNTYIPPAEEQKIREEVRATM